MNETRTAVLAAFKDLRKLGVAARANFMCCMGCATAAAPKGKPFVYWHKQDDERFRETGTLDLRYCAPKEKDVAPLAGRIVSALSDHGIRFEWSGSTDETITVIGLYKRS